MSQLQLVIVESPTKARTLSRFLGKNYRIVASLGHVRDLPEKRLGVDIIPKVTSSDGKAVEYSFVPNYQVISERKSHLTQLKKLSQQSSSIILATDPDREGEAIAYHVMHVIQAQAKGEKPDSKFLRIVFHEITESAIKDAFLHPKDIDMQLVDAQQARRVLDRLVGYKLSPLLWNKLGKRWLSAGRVQSVAVRLIVEREREIKAFKPVEYWIIEVELKSEESLNSFIAKLVEIDGKKADVGNKEQADTIVDDLKNSAYTVSSIDTKEIRKTPPPPFTTSTLQQSASNRFGWTAKRVMRAAQNLYEEGYITYHRTDSTNLASAATESVRMFIAECFGGAFLPPTARIYKTKSKVAQEAHEAIRPTNPHIVSPYDQKNTPSILKLSTIRPLDASLGRDGELLYSLIWKRFVACQMNEAVFDQTSITVAASKKRDGSLNTNSTQYTLRAGGQIVKFSGWMEVYGEKLSQKSKVKSQNNQNEKNSEEHTQEEKNGEEQMCELPHVTVGELLALLQLLPKQKFTEPPARFNEASLIKALEEKGIGRPSTYASIISTIQDRKYVEKIEKRFHPTDLGKLVSDFLVSHFPTLFDIAFTAKMEDELDEIANGKLPWMKVINEFYVPLKDKIDYVFASVERVKVDLGTTDEKCPKCGSPLAIKLSKYGKFLACTAYPTCVFTKNILEKIGIPCPKCAGDMIVKKTRLGKQFYGCSNYPTCTFAAWKKEEIK